MPRLRQIAMILVFDLGGPLLAYSLLRSAGTRAVTALVISGVLPAPGSSWSPMRSRSSCPGWTLVYGEHEKKKAERLAITGTGTGTSTAAGT